ncbi:MAG: helix-turn-helix transcriptional regulator [Clostridia bacterium]|nr:helix-turn-helix transcriptional regulator [Clostridia bacterium]
MKTDYATISNQRLCEARKKAGFTQETAAERLGMKRNTYARMERLGNPTFEELAKITALYNVSADWLLYGEDDCRGDSKFNYELNSKGPKRLAQQTRGAGDLPFAISPYELKCLKLLHLVRKKQNRDAVLDFINNIRKAEIEENEKKQNSD